MGKDDTFHKRQFANLPQTPRTQADCPNRSRLINAIDRKIKEKYAELDEPKPENEVDGVFWRKRKKRKK